MNTRKGFTLVEILVVIVIIAALFAIAVPSIMGISKKMKVRGFEAKVESIEQAAVNFVQDNANKIKDKYGEEYIKDGKYTFTMTVKDLINYDAYESEKDRSTTCNVTNPMYKDKCLDCAKITITLDEKYKTAKAEIDVSKDTYLENSSITCENLLLDINKKDESEESSKTIMSFSARIDGSSTFIKGTKLEDVPLFIKETYEDGSTDEYKYEKGESSYEISGYQSEEVGDNKVLTVTINNTHSGNNYEGNKDYTVKYSIFQNTTILLNANGGSFTNASSNIGANTKTTTIRYGNTYGSGTLGSIESLILKRADYIFDGWYTDPVNGTRIYDSTTVTIEENHTLYAHWKPNNYNYIVNHYLMDADGNYSSNPNYSETRITVPNGEAPRKTDIGIEYKQPAVQKVTSNNMTINYYYERNTYKVTLNANGGSFTSASSNVGVSTKITTIRYGNTYDSGTLGSIENGMIPTRTGFEFDGWYTEASGGEKVTDITIMRKMNDHTLYAHWIKKVTYKVYHFYMDKNGQYPKLSGSYTSDEIIVETRESAIGWSVTPGVKEKTGFISPTAQTIVINSESNYISYYYERLYKVVTLYTNGYSYDGDGLKDHIDEKIYYLANKKLPYLEAADYGFRGWYEKNNKESGMESKDRIEKLGFSSLSENRNSSLYAIWFYGYTVNYNTDLKLFGFVLDNDNATPLKLDAFQNSKDNKWYAVTRIEDKAFYRIKYGTWNIAPEISALTIGYSTKYIGENLFDDTGNHNHHQLTNLTIEMVKEWGGYSEQGSFYHCIGLSEVILGENITNIGAGAFSMCSGLKSIKVGDSYMLKDKVLDIPESITNIGNCAFSGCTSLEEIRISNTTTLGTEVFRHCNNVKAVRLPDDITKIPSFLFADCPSLTSITIPNSVTSIGYCAFIVSGLTSVTIPGSVANIGESAFEETPLERVEIKNGVESIDMKAFSGCRNLRSITIPGSVKDIGRWAFANSGLGTATINYGVTSIGDNAFVGCSSLESVTIPTTVTYIDHSAFQNCYNLASIIYAGVEYKKDNDYGGCADTTGFSEAFKKYNSNNYISTSAFVWNPKPDAYTTTCNYKR